MSTRPSNQGGPTPAHSLPAESLWSRLSVESLAAAAADIAELDATATSRVDADPLDAALYDVATELATIGQHWVQAVVCALQDLTAELRGRRIVREERA